MCNEKPESLRELAASLEENMRHSWKGQTRQLIMNWLDRNSSNSFETTAEDALDRARMTLSGESTGLVAALEALDPDHRVIVVYSSSEGEGEITDWLEVYDAETLHDFGIAWDGSRLC